MRDPLPIHTRYLATRYFPALDGLRCLSILLVIGFHCRLTNTSLFHHGKYGVSLFFVISGFLITTLLLREQSKHGQISLRDFYLRRTLRIFPLYYAVAAIYVALVLKMEHGPERADFFRHLPFYLTYTSNWFVDKDAAPRVIFAFSWSLATEEQFYLVWPSIVRFARRRTLPLLVIIAALVATVAANSLVFLGVINLGETGNRIITSIAAPICMGCVLAYSFESPRAFSIVRPVLGRLFSAPAALLLTAVFYALGWMLPAEAAMVLLVGACCIRNDNGLAWLMSNAIVRYVGAISYGIYLLHMLAINGTHKLVPSRGWLSFVVATLLSLILASLSYHFYERPFLRLKDRLSRRSQSKSAPASAPAPVLAAVPV